MDKPPDAPTGPSVSTTTTTNNGLQDSKGWDGKLRVERRALVTNAEILSDPEYSDEDAPPVMQIAADEGSCLLVFNFTFLLTGMCIDLLEDYEPDSDVSLFCCSKSLSSRY